MAKKTGYHISTDPVFYLARTTKASNTMLSKWTQGLGQSNNQCMPLNKAQIIWSGCFTSPWYSILCLEYEKKPGDLKRICDSHGSIIRVMLTMHWVTKKRPFALVTNFTWTEMKQHPDLLPHTGPLRRYSTRSILPPPLMSECFSLIGYIGGLAVATDLNNQTINHFG